jgi:hypothetical protein
MGGKDVWKTPSSPRRTATSHGPDDTTALSKVLRALWSSVMVGRACYEALLFAVTSAGSSGRQGSIEEVLGYTPQRCTSSPALCSACLARLALQQKMEFSHYPCAMVSQEGITYETCPSRAFPTLEQHSIQPFLDSPCPRL